MKTSTRAAPHAHDPGGCSVTIRSASSSMASSERTYSAEPSSISRLYSWFALSNRFFFHRRLPPRMSYSLECRDAYLRAATPSTHAPQAMSELQGSETRSGNACVIAISGYISIRN